MRKLYTEWKGEGDCHCYPHKARDTEREVYVLTPDELQALWDAARAVEFSPVLGATNTSPRFDTLAGYLVTVEEK